MRLNRQRMFWRKQRLRESHDDGQRESAERKREIRKSSRDRARLDQAPADRPPERRMKSQPYIRGQVGQQTQVQNRLRHDRNHAHRAGRFSDVRRGHSGKPQREHQRHGYHTYSDHRQPDEHHQIGPAPRHAEIIRQRPPGRARRLTQRWRGFGLERMRRAAAARWIAAPAQQALAARVEADCRRRSS